MALKGILGKASQAAKSAAKTVGDFVGRAFGGKSKGSAKFGNTAKGGAKKSDHPPGTRKKNRKPRSPGRKKGAAGHQVSRRFGG